MTGKEFDAVLSQYIRPLTFPVGIKLFTDDEGLPERMRVPSRDFKYRVAFCQGIAMARRYGWTLGFFEEDQACSLSQFILGYREEPDFVKDGSLCTPLYVKDMEAGKLTQETTPKMPKANTHCLVVGPLNKIAFEPDVVVVYGNAAQVIRMVQGSLYSTGGFVESRFSGRGACGSEFTVPYTQNKCNVIIPGGGEKVFAATEDTELAFALPASMMEDIAEGLAGTHKAGAARYPTPLAGIRAEPAFPAEYDALADFYGMNDEK